MPGKESKIDTDKKSTSCQTVLVIESHARAAVAVIKSLLGHGLEVAAASDHRYCAGFFVKGLKKRLIYPPIENNPDEFIEWLLNYLRLNKTKMLFPLGNAGVELVSRYQEELRQYTNLFVSEHSSFVIAYDKIQANKAAEAVCVPIPQSWYPDETGLDSVIKSARFPLVIKPNIGVGARGIIRVNSPIELEKVWKSAQKSKYRMFVQKFIEHPARQYVVDMLLDKQFNSVAAVASEKVRFFPVKGGASTLSRSIHNSDLYNNSAKLLKSIGYYGISNIDWIEDSEDGILKFLEINPRFGEMHGICNAVGVDMPYYLYKLAMGETFSAIKDYIEDKYFRFLPTDLMWFLSSPERFKAKPGFLASFRNDVTHTLFEANDYGPLLGYILENLLLLAKPHRFLYRFRR
ncbi:MAG: ATP-grasp domain-containing protein [Phycisphaerae bacterium]|jgi:predicted ATP-grasp superfamily ATP-dependent carboligase